MTTLNKSAAFSNISRKVNRVEPANNTKNRQDLATSGKNLPFTNPTVETLKPTSPNIEQVIKSIYGYVQNIKTELNFSVEEDLNRSIVTVIDKETGKIIRQIPSKELVELAKHFNDTQEIGNSQPPKGILFERDA